MPETETRIDLKKETLSKKFALTGLRRCLAARRGCFWRRLPWRLFGIADLSQPVFQLGNPGGHRVMACSQGVKLLAGDEPPGVKAAFCALLDDIVQFLTDAAERGCCAVRHLRHV